MVFVTGEDIHDCLSIIKTKWFGDPTSVHVDSYAELQQIDGHSIDLSTKTRTAKSSLYFVNLGYSNPASFGESHVMTFIVADSLAKAKIRAKELFPKNTTGHHLDNLLKLSRIDSYYITPTLNHQNKDFEFTNVYWKL